MRRQATVLCGTLRVFRSWFRGTGRLRIAAQGKFVTPLAKAGDEAIEDRFARGLGFFCSFSGHGRLASENQLRDVSQGNGITTRDALAGELPDEIAEEEIHFIGSGEAVDVRKEFGGESLGVHRRRSGCETSGMEGAERWAGGTVGWAMSEVDQHVAAVAAGVSVLTLRIRVLL
jgi:hypothetical protein